MACEAYGFKVTRSLGQGAFGAVYEATKAGEVDAVAVKHITRRFHSWSECMQQRELHSLHKMQREKGPHPNIVCLREVIHSKTDGSVFIVMEYVNGGNLYDSMKRDPALFDDAGRVAGIIRDVLRGCAHMHRRGFFHRDIKPENLLVATDASATVIKIADFGCAREIRSAPPYTDYVSTRWYRAPENALRSREYSSPTDVWACGVVLAELLGRGQPLFPAMSELDLVHRHFKLRGDPWAVGWIEGCRLATELRILRKPSSDVGRAATATAAAAATSTANPRLYFEMTLHDDATSLCEDLLNLNPSARPSAAAALDHRFIALHAPPGAPEPRRPTSGVCQPPQQGREHQQPPSARSNKPAPDHHHHQQQQPPLSARAARGGGQQPLHQERSRLNLMQPPDPNQRSTFHLFPDRSRINLMADTALSPSARGSSMGDSASNHHDHDHDHHPGDQDAPPLPRVQQQQQQQQHSGHNIDPSSKFSYDTLNGGLPQTSGPLDEDRPPGGPPRGGGEEDQGRPRSESSTTRIFPSSLTVQADPLARPDQHQLFSPIADDILEGLDGSWALSSGDATTQHNNHHHHHRRKQAVGPPSEGNSLKEAPPPRMMVPGTFESMSSSTRKLAELSVDDMAAAATPHKLRRSMEDPSSSTRQLAQLSGDAMASLVRSQSTNDGPAAVAVVAESEEEEGGQRGGGGHPLEPERRMPRNFEPSARFSYDDISADGIVKMKKKPTARDEEAPRDLPPRPRREAPTPPKGDAAQAAGPPPSSSSSSSSPPSSEQPTSTNGGASLLDAWSFSTRSGGVSRTPLDRPADISAADRSSATKSAVAKEEGPPSAATEAAAADDEGAAAAAAAAAASSDAAEVRPTPPEARGAANSKSSKESSVRRKLLSFGGVLRPSKAPASAPSSQEAKEASSKTKKRAW